MTPEMEETLKSVYFKLLEQDGLFIPIGLHQELTRLANWLHAFDTQDCQPVSRAEILQMPLSTNLSQNSSFY